MKSITIKGSERESVGKVSTKALRNAGMVPCVVYGGEQPVHFSADERAFKNLVYTPNVHTVVIELEGGKKINAIMQPANLPDFIEADITPLQMGNKLYVTKIPVNNFKLLHPDNTVVCQVRISRAAMKAAQEAAKAAKAAPAKKK